jgi:hypothetical protein
VTVAADFLLDASQRFIETRIVVDARRCTARGAAESENCKEAAMRLGYARPLFSA